MHIPHHHDMSKDSIVSIDDRPGFKISRGLTEFRLVPVSGGRWEIWVSENHELGSIEIQEKKIKFKVELNAS